MEERPWDLLAISSSPGWTLAGVSRPNMSLPSGRYGQLRGARGGKGQGGAEALIGSGVSSRGRKSGSGCRNAFLYVNKASKRVRLAW